MALKYQKGTVYPRGKKVKMWYGKYTVYFRNEKERRSESGAMFRSAQKQVRRSGRQSRCCTPSFSMRQESLPRLPRQSRMTR